MQQFINWHNYHLLSTQIIILYITSVQNIKQEMGPKKKVDPGAEDDAQKAQFLQNKVKALQLQIIWQQQRVDRSKTQQKIMRQQIVTLDQNFKKCKDELFLISNKMTQQYDSKQQQLKKKVQQKRRQLAERQSDIKKSKESLRTCKQEYEEKLRQKQKELTDLKQKMEDMSIQFSRMLRETLEKMQERIQLQQWDNQSDPQLIKKMKDLSELYSG